MTKKIMLLGTASSVGKSTIATAFCRYFKEKGYNVAPYKALNISLNSFVTEEGDEIGRSQVVQAEACNIKPKEYMNPILMKPSGNFKTQVIVRGKVYCNMDAYKYEDLNKYLKEAAKEAFIDISKDHDLIVLEGSGSCSEINLKKTDIANMHTAKATDSNVILVADIDRGGVFASIVGTLNVLSEDERKRVKGIIVNKFRGKKEYFKGAMKQIEEMTGVKVLGVMPHFKLDIEEEDGATDNIKNTKGEGVDIAVIRLPHMSNFTDFNSLAIMENVNVRYVDNIADLEGANMIIIPGSKNTIEDLKFIKENGFNHAINYFKYRGALIFGICGGYQILGNVIKDPLEVEGKASEEEGLKLLDMWTYFEKEKTTKQVNTKDIYGNEVSGYEIHNGVSKCTNEDNVWIRDNEGNVVGMKNEDSTVYGTYLHGIFDEGNFRVNIINKLKEKLDIKKDNDIDYASYKIKQYDKLCEILKENIDMEYVESIL
ncbi:cobyric acid synthase [Clostridium baratii]|uniref:Cobyric acid synthase n=1 Tax=Clostridium baratii TaxID=1561 RepID=A0A174U8D6_9CLOT|nr:cobyric acid synthase [Clostridium baratii]CUQ15279.1 cobyric acid synthase [Clostridium baratii]